jgi:amiloride-sensitive sodium channel
VSAIHVSFGQKKFQTMRRSELFGFIDFISNCGGLMALFMGISIISFAELIHYFFYFIQQLYNNFFDNRIYFLN